jgi:hypothetical protein
MFPYGRLVAIAVGGMLGGLMWAWRSKAKRQVAFYAILGPFVALCLLWAIQANLIPLVHEDAISNVLWIFVISFLAGWGRNRSPYCHSAARKTVILKLMATTKTQWKRRNNQPCPPCEKQMGMFARKLTA